MSIKYIDTHAHLQDRSFAADRKQLVTDTYNSGVGIINVSIDHTDAEQNLVLAQQYNLWATVGIHPNHVLTAEKEREQSFQLIADLAKQSIKNNDGIVVAIGETGLDYYRNRVATDLQKVSLQFHLDLALELKLPVILHVRDADNELIQAIQNFLAADGQAVVHCFSVKGKSAPELMQRYLDLSVYFGLGGVVTYPDMKALRQLLGKIPDQRLLLETDCPYLMPQPRINSERRNAPLGVLRVAEELALLRGVSVEDIGRITTANARRLFKLMPRSGGIVADVSFDAAEAIYAYRIRDSIYINLTNRCNLCCDFCPKSSQHSLRVKGYDLTLLTEPSVSQVLSQVKDLLPGKEVVFCGYGESTLRLDALIAIAGELKRLGLKTRLNTNGLANLQYNTDITPRLVGVIDTVSVSLNSADPKQYAAVCHHPAGEAAHAAVCDFIRCAVNSGLHTIASVVTLPEIDVSAAEALTKQLGAEFRARPADNLG